MNINDLIKEAHQTAVEKGWWDKPNDFDTQITNMHAELSVAWEEYRNGNGLNDIYYHESMSMMINTKQSRKPEGIPIELADVIIRICDTLGHINYNYEDSISKGILIEYDSFAKFISGCHCYLSKALDHRSYSFNWFHGLILEIETYCILQKIDLTKAIELKMAYNKTRPYRHGNKRA